MTDGAVTSLACDETDFDEDRLGSLMEVFKQLVRLFNVLTDPMLCFIVDDNPPSLDISGDLVDYIILFVQLAPLFPDVAWGVLDFPSHAVREFAGTRKGDEAGGEADRFHWSKTADGHKQTVDVPQLGFVRRTMLILAI